MHHILDLWKRKVRYNVKSNDSFKLSAWLETRGDKVQWNNSEPRSFPAPHGWGFERLYSELDPFAVKKPNSESFVLPVTLTLILQK